MDEKRAGVLTAVNRRGGVNVTRCTNVRRTYNGRQREPQRGLKGFLRFTGAEREKA